MIGSLQDRDLLDRVFKNADALHEDVAAAMQGPLAAVEAEASVDEIVTALTGGSNAVSSRRAVRPVGVVTRSTCSSTCASLTVNARDEARAASEGTCRPRRRRRRRSAGRSWGRKGTRAASGAPAQDDVEGAIRRLTAVQLDSISTVDRAHRLTLSARIGAFDPEIVPQLLRSGRIFEYWAHEASLLPVELWPHFRRVMDGAGHWGAHDRALREHADLVEPILARIRDEGPLGSRDFEGNAAAAGCGTGSRRRWCSTPCGTAAELVIAGRRSFQRLYDLPERVIPKDVLDAPTPSEDETLRTLALLAVRSRGALTEPAIREHWRLKGGKARLHHHLIALVDDGALREVHADDGGAPFFVAAGRGARRRPGPARARLPVRQPRLGPPAARAPSASGT